MIVAWMRGKLGQSLRDGSRPIVTSSNWCWMSSWYSRLPIKNAMTHSRVVLAYILLLTATTCCGLLFVDGFFTPKESNNPKIINEIHSTRSYSLDRKSNYFKTTLFWTWLSLSFLGVRGGARELSVNSLAIPWARIIIQTRPVQTILKTDLVI